MKTILLAALLALAASAAWAGGAIKVFGPSGTAVYLDGVHVGEVPLVLEDLRPGTHQIRLIGPSGEQRSRAVQVPSTLDSYQELDAASMGVDLDALLMPPYWNAPYFTPQPFRYDPWYSRPLGHAPFRVHRRIHTPHLVPPAPPRQPHPRGPGRHRNHR